MSRPRSFPALHRTTPASRRGFTLIELLVTIAIIGILSSIAMPSMRDVLENSKVATRAEDLSMSMYLARSEAVKRNAPVTVCRSSDGSTCLADQAGNWNTGWIVFVDGGTIGSRANTEELLSVRAAPSGSFKLAASGNLLDYVTYRSDGQAINAAGAAHSGNITVCSNMVSVKRRRLSLSAGTGAVRNVELAGATDCTAS